MTLEQLRVLHAIVVEGTFHGAALRLNKSQPALSHMIKKLEEEISVQIISRENYRPQLTPSGEIFYRKSLHVLEETNQLKMLSQQLAGEQEAQIHLAISATCDLPPLLSNIHIVRQEYPNTHIRLSIETMGGPLERLLEKEADFIIATMDGVSTEDVISVPYAEISIIPVCQSTYLSGSHKEQKSSSDMRDYTQIVVADSGSGPYKQSRDLLPENQKWTVSDFASKKEIIKSKMGWGGLPKHLIADELKTGELVVLDLDFFPIRESKLMLIRNRDYVLGPVGQSLWKQIVA